MKLNKTVLLSLCGILVGMSAWSAPPPEKCSPRGNGAELCVRRDTNGDVSLVYKRDASGAVTPVNGFLTYHDDSAQVMFETLVKASETSSPFNGGTLVKRVGKNYECTKNTDPKGDIYYQCVISVKNPLTGEIF